MAEPMEVTITLDLDAVERLPLRWTTPRTPEEYQAAQRGEDFPVSLDDFVNDAIRYYPTVEEVREGHRKIMIRSGMLLGDPEYTELWEEEYGDDSEAS